MSDKKNIPGILVVLTSAMLLAIWPLPGTMAIRHLLLLTGCIASLLVIKDNIPTLISRDAWPVHLLLLFFVWLLVHYMLLAHNPVEQWRELTGDWIRTFFATVIGIALGLILFRPERHLPPQFNRHLQSVLIAGLSGTIAIFCARYAYEVWQTGNWIHWRFYMTPYLGKTPLVIFGSIFLPILFIKLLQVITKKEDPHWYFWGILGITGTLLTYYFGDTKNGFAVFALLLVVFLVRALMLVQGNMQPEKRYGIYAFLVASLVLSGFVIKAHLQANPSWLNLVADYKISVQIDKHTNWKDRIAPYPLNEYGQTAHASTYERVAWARAGLELLKENPLGYGQINHSFGALAIQKWSDFHRPDGINRGSTHSGWLDFALGLGIPGLLLVCIPLAVSYWRARKRSDLWSTYAVWTIPVIAFTYLITEVCTGHFIELLFFLTALFTSLTIRKAPSATAAHGD